MAPRLAPARELAVAYSSAKGVFVMKLPNGDRSTIEPRKVTEYCLSPEHDDGRHKANSFRGFWA